MIVDGQKVTAQIDLGAHISSISSGFCDLLALEFHPMGRLLELEGTRGFVILFLGYIEVNLQIQGIKSYNEDIPFLVHPYHDLLQEGPSHGWVQNYRLGDGNDDQGGAGEGNCDLETGSLWCSYVWIVPVAPHNLKGRWRSRKGDPSLPKL